MKIDIVQLPGRGQAQLAVLPRMRERKCRDLCGFKFTRSIALVQWVPF